MTYLPWLGGYALLLGFVAVAGPLATLRFLNHRSGSDVMNRNRVEVTVADGEVVVHPGGDWVHKTRSGALQVRRGTFRRLATYRADEWRGFVITSGGRP